MKKTQFKLKLKTNTIRALQVRELSAVNGGSPRPRSTFGCGDTQVQTACSHPPNHPPTSGHH